ncbi:MAG: hypothetical protein KJO13_00070 [Gammaproteobacteria bacterium]|nr:hypothetical protein [Gammaproteobacteria bacterium]
MTQFRYIVIIVAFLAARTVSSTEILDASVVKKDGVYHVFGESIVEAPPDFIFATLIDYDNFYKISSGIPETRFVESDDPDEVLAYTRIEACVMFFCRSAERLERIESTPYEEIHTQALPEHSDFEIYESRWTLSRHDRGTRVTHEARFKPDFWMPPLISNWAIKRKLIESAENIGIRIEYLQDNGLQLSQIAPPEKK